MKKKYNISELKELNETVVNTSILTGAVIGGIVWIITLFRVSETGLVFTYFTDFFGVAVFTLMYIFRNKISLYFRTNILIVIVLILYISTLHTFGITIAVVLFFLLFTFFCIQIYSIWTTLIISIFQIIVFIIYGILFHKHILVSLANNRMYNTELKTWMIGAGLIFMTVIIITYYLSSFKEKVTILVAELQKKNAEISKSEANLKAIFDNTNNIIGLYDTNLILQEYNHAFYLYTLQTDNFELYKGIDILSKINQELANQFRGYLKRALQGERFKEYVEYPSEIGSLHFLLSYTPIYKNSEISGVSMFVEDITELKSYQKELEKHTKHLEKLVHDRTLELEATNEEVLATNDELMLQREELEKTIQNLTSTQEQLIHAEKMASLGLLAAGVAHEINNPLNFIKGGIDGINTFIDEKKITRSTDVNFFIHAIEEGVRRASSIVSSLNHFTREDKHFSDNILLQNLIKNCLVILENQSKHKATIIQNYSEERIYIVGNEGKLHQAILNIISNAVQALNENGEINIDVKQSNADTSIKITDNGVGISRENLKKIKDPFFTTKDPGKGTGLGLSITQKIIEEHSGELFITSELGVGTSVVIRLPKINS